MLCPAYKRLGGDPSAREAHDEELWRARLASQLEAMLESDSDVLCVQEAWLANEGARALLVGGLEAGGYACVETPRTGGRDDGLLCAVRRGRAEVVDSSSVLFRDCGDRVAQLLRVQTAAGGQFLLINCHLLFPHNPNSTLIRLRETFKLLEALQAYRDAVEGAEALPVVACGDWNGSLRGRVSRFLRSQGFVACVDEQACDEDKYISHRNHHGELVGCDNVFLLNPSSARESLTADWRRAVFAMMEAKIVELMGVSTTEKAFQLFDANSNSLLEADEMRALVDRLGLTGEGTIGLMPSEVEELVETMDSTRQGAVSLSDFSSWIDVESFSQAYGRVRSATEIWEEDGWDPQVDISTARAAPACAAFARSPAPGGAAGEMVPLAVEVEECALDGSWPKGFDLSDHVMVSASLCFS